MTTNEKWSVPDTTVTVPTSVSPDGLTSLVKGLLTEADTDFDVEEVGFDFIVFDQLIRTTLGDVIQAKEDVSASEAVVEVTYVERYVCALYTVCNTHIRQFSCAQGPLQCIVLWQISIRGG